MAVSVYFSTEVSQGSTYFLGEYYSREYLKVKIPYSNLFQGEYLFPEGSNYLLVNKYWGSKYFPVNNYWGVLFFGEYLITVTPEATFLTVKKNERSKIKCMIVKSHDLH